MTIAEEFGIATTDLTKHEIQSEVRAAVGEPTKSVNGLRKKTLMRIVLLSGVPVGEDDEPVNAGSSVESVSDSTLPSQDPSPARCKHCDVQSDEVMPRETKQRKLALCPTCADARRALHDQDLGSEPQGRF